MFRGRYTSYSELSGFNEWLKFSTLPDPADQPHGRGPGKTWEDQSPHGVSVASVAVCTHWQSNVNGNCSIYRWFFPLKTHSVGSFPSHVSWHQWHLVAGPLRPTAGARRLGLRLRQGALGYRCAAAQGTAGYGGPPWNLANGGCLGDLSYEKWNIIGQNPHWFTPVFVG